MSHDKYLRTYIMTRLMQQVNPVGDIHEWIVKHLLFQDLDQIMDHEPEVIISAYYWAFWNEFPQYIHAFHHSRRDVIEDLTDGAELPEPTKLKTLIFLTPEEKGFGIGLWLARWVFGITEGELLEILGVDAFTRGDYLPVLHMIHKCNKKLEVTHPDLVNYQRHRRLLLRYYLETRYNVSL